MKKLVLALSLLVLAAGAQAADSPRDVQALIARGDYAGAEAMLRHAVAEHPQSAKAHYVLAEVLAHEGNIGDAKAEANKAATLDPATHFTDPAKFQHFQRELDAALAPAGAVRSTPARALSGEAKTASAGGGSGFPTGWLIVVAVIALGAFLWSRRRRDAGAPFGGSSFPPPVDNTPPYGGYQSGPGYQGGPGYGYPPAQSRSGVGAAVAAGIGGLAAGALLDEALRSHRDGEVTREVGTGGTRDVDSRAEAYDDLRDDPIDMGNNDSSWDDGSSGGGGSFDDDQW